MQYILRFLWILNISNYIVHVLKSVELNSSHYEDFQLNIISLWLWIMSYDMRSIMCSIQHGDSAMCIRY